MKNSSRAITHSEKAEKAELILNVVYDLYLKSSFNDIKMIDIALKCGVSKGTLFNYYNTKEKLFLSLLRREYKKRFESLTDKLKVIKSMDHYEFKKFILEEMNSILEKDSVLIRLTSILHIILEANIDYETALEFKSEFYSATKKIGMLISEKVDYMNLEDAMELFMTQHAVVVGYRNVANVPPVIKKVIEEQNYIEFNVEFKKNALRTIEYYLEGLYMNKAKKWIIKTYS